MKTNPLHTIMNPNSIAFVGASNNVSKMGTIQCLNLIGNDFPGDILPVHPRDKTVLGRTAYASVGDLPYAPDLAVLVVPTRLVPEFLEEFGKIGTRQAIIISGGFRETGMTGQDLECRIIDVARQYNMRFVGPNCVGIINTQLPLNLTVAPVQDLNGKLGIASQSGTYITQNLSYLHKHGIKISKAISIGNGTDIDIVECLEYLGEDDATKAIALYIEGISRAGDFLDVARRVSSRKPIIAQYVGGTEAGARAGSSHTGAMAGPDYIYKGLFEQAGIIRVNSIEEVFKGGWALASQPPLRGSRIAVLTNSGGPGTGIATTCNLCHLDVPEFSDEIRNKIGEHIPGHASSRNPVDLTFHLDMSLLADKLPRIVFEADEIDGVVIHGIIDTGFIDEIYPLIANIMNSSEPGAVHMPETDLTSLVTMPHEHGKPLIISSFFGREDHAVRTFHEHDVPVYDAPEKAARAMGVLHQYNKISNRSGCKELPRMEIPSEAMDEMNRNNAGCDEYRAKRILKAYGIPTTDETIVSTVEDALNAAQAVGYPVALKACSPGILHKTEAGMVHLNIETDIALRNAFASIREREPDVAVLVSEMLHGDREFMAGMSRFPGFPPCIMFGLGGVFAEAMKDRTIRLSPLNYNDAISMLESLNAAALLGPYRSMAPVDIDALAKILIALGEMALHFPSIQEMDLNPIIIVNGQPKVADALIVM